MFNRKKQRLVAAVICIVLIIAMLASLLVYLV